MSSLPEHTDEEFIKLNEVDEVVPDSPAGEQPPVSDNEEDNGDGGDEHEDVEDIEIDMRNNSTTFFDSHSDSVYLVASHPTLPLVVSGGGDNTAYLWTTSHSPPRVAAKLTEHTESVITGGFTANGRFLVTGDMSGRLIVWKSNSTGEKWTLLSNTQEVDEIVYISIHPTESMFAVGEPNGSVWCYEISDDVVNIAVLQTHSMGTTAAAFVPSDPLHPRLLTIGEDGLMVLWEVYESRAIYTLGPSHLRGEHPWVSLALSPTGKTMAVGSMDGFVALVKLEDGAVLNMIDTTTVKVDKPRSSNEPASAEDEDHKKEQGEDGMDDDDDDEEEEDGRSLEGLAWSDKTGLLATGNVDGTIVLWDTQSWRPRSQFQLGASVTQMQFLPQSKYLFVSGMDGSLIEYDVINSEKVWEGLGHNEGILSFAVQNGGKRIISGSDDQVCLVFDKE